MRLPMLAAILAVATPAGAQTGSDWMSFIPDSWDLGAFSIPGTHETCARFETIPDTAICQSLTLAQQLEVGVRALDIRCRHIEDVFAIHHGIEYQNLSFGDVLSTVSGFLEANPSEAVIMNVKEEYRAADVTRAFWETFEAYHALDPDRWYVGEALPSLGSVRGKIILVRRFATSGRVRGINADDGWTYNVPSTIDVGAHLRVQDWNQLPDLEPATVDAKWQLVRQLVGEAVAEGIAETPLQLNHTSGHDLNIFGIPRGIIALAADLNPRLRLQFHVEPKVHAGTILVDFVTPELARTIYLSSIPGVVGGGEAGLASPDSDFDGTPDAEEVKAGGDPFDYDGDGDGTSNLDEHRAGTDPLDPASDLEVQVREIAGGAIVSWNADPERTYRVVACGIDPTTGALLEWRPVEVANACGFAHVEAPIGSDGAPLPERLRRWRVELEPPGCGPDLDRSGRVDGHDLARMLARWGGTGCAAADLDGDGEVGGADLAVLVGAWGPCGP